MLGKIYLRAFGRFVEPYIEYFDELKFGLKQADMKYSIQAYVSMLVFFSVVTFVAVLAAMLILLSILMSLDAYLLTLSVIASIWAAGGAFFAGYYYPTVKSSGMKNRLEKDLPFSVIYMATAAASDLNPEDLFKILSTRDSYVGRECSKIYNGMHMLGMDPITALTKAANKTPSTKFAELLWGIISIVEQGGSMREYLEDKAKDFMNQYRRSLGDYSKQISFYTEIYITLIIVGTLFFIVLSSIMSPLVGGDILIMQTFLVFIFIPLISAGFIVLLKGLYPS
jgi:flagellar protein FlaJ